MITKEDRLLRDQLIHALRGDQSQITFAKAIEDFPAELRGRKAEGAPHTAWQLLEHLRIAQNDILDFSRNADYQAMKWPDDYWPKSAAPPDAHAWDKSVKAFESELLEMEELVKDPNQDLFKVLAHGDGQTLLQEALTLATHNSYHLGQLIFLKKMLS
jgi:hypothetical protein